MSISFKTDQTAFRNEMTRINLNRPGARRAALRTMTWDFSSTVEFIAPQDTRRYLRGWMMAANDVLGQGTFHVPSVRASKVSTQIFEGLENQVLWWEQIVDTYERKGRDDVWYRRALRARKRAEKALDDWLETKGTGIVIGARARRGKSRPRGGRYGRGSFRIVGKRSVATVRTKIYGGEGRWIENGPETIVELHNKEAHATIVEHNNHVRRIAGARARAFGARNVSRKYIKKLLVGTGQARPAA